LPLPGPTCFEKSIQTPFEAFSSPKIYLTEPDFLAEEPPSGVADALDERFAELHHALGRTAEAVTEGALALLTEDELADFPSLRTALEDSGVAAVWIEGVTPEGDGRLRELLRDPATDLFR